MSAPETNDQQKAVVFVCPEWTRTNGMCCPGGAVRLGCPGKTVNAYAVDKKDMETERMGADW